MRYVGFTKALIAVFVAQSCVPLTLNLAQAQYDNTYCDAVCGQIVDSKSDKLLGLNGTDGWTAQDAQTCSQYASTLPGTGPAPSPLPVPLPSPWPSTTQMQNQCNWEPGQVGQQCLAYEASGSAGGFDKLLVPLDMATAGLCWGACLTPPPYQHPLEVTCNIAGIASSAAEIIDVFVDKSSAVGKAIDGALGAAGIAGGIMGIKDLGAAAASASAANAAKAANGGIADAGAGSSYTNAGNAENTANGKAKKMACAEAVLMTVEAVLRMKNMNSADSTRQTACNQVQALASSSSTIGSGGTPGGAMSGSTGTIQSASAPYAPNAGLSNGKGYANPLQCAQVGMGTQPGGCGLSSQQLSAADATGLNTQLGPAVASQGIDTSGLMNRLASGEDPGQVMGSAFSGPGADALANLAKVTSEHAAELGAAGGAAPTAATGGGSAPAKASAFNFGLGDLGVASPAQTDQSFAPKAKAPLPEGDIWHTGYPGTIFEIVTQKIDANRDRVDNLDWSTPLNRALAGGTSKPKAKP